MTCLAGLLHQLFTPRFCCNISGKRKLNGMIQSPPGQPIILGKVEIKTPCFVPEVHCPLLLPKGCECNFGTTHGFNNAFEDAYTAVIYLRMVDSNGTVHVSLVMAKTKVVPIKCLTVPCLEYAQPISFQVYSTTHKKCLKSPPAMCLPGQTARLFLAGS